MSGKDIFIFLGGAVTGSLITYKLIKDKHEKILQEEISSVKKAYSGKIEPDSVETEPDDKSATKKLKEMIRHYTGADSETNKEEEGDNSDMHDGYMITQEEYGDYENYMQVPLAFFSDGVLTDELNIPIDDAEDILFEGYAKKLKNTFKTGKEDVLYFRNDQRRADYEIAYDERVFTEVVN